MKKVYTILLFCLSFSLFATASADTLLKGLPFIQNYSVKDYTGHAQNWSIIQANDGKMYFGNTEGILEFNGKNWRLIKLPNESGVLSLAKDNNGKIYAGAFGDLGFLDKDSLGVLQYNSLKSLIPHQYKQFEAVWETIVTRENEVFFRTTGAIYKYLPTEEKFQVIQPETQFLRFFYMNGKIFLREENKGLEIIDKSKADLVQGGEFFANRSIYGIESYSDSSFLIFTRESVFLYFPGTSSFKPFKTGVDKYIKAHRVYNTAKLQNGWYAIATSTGGVVFIDKEGKQKYILNEQKGLIDNTVRYLFIDNFHNLWTATNNGISYIILNSPVTCLNKRAGLSGIIFNTAFYNNKLYVASSTGLYHESLIHDFAPVENTSGEVFMLQEIDGELYAANSNNMFIINEKKAKKVLNNYTWNLCKYTEKGNKQYFIAGSVDGLYVYEKTGQNWRIFSKVKGFDIYSRYMKIDEKKHVWVAHTHKGIYRIRISEDLKNCTIKHYTQKNGLPETIDNRVYKANIEGEEKVIFTTDSGIYDYQYANDTFVKNGFFSQYLGNDKEITRFDQNGRGNICFIRGRTPGLLINNDNAYNLVTTPFSKLKGIEIEHVNILNNNTIIFGTDDGIYLYDHEKRLMPKGQFNTYINKVITPDTTIYQELDNSSSIPVFSYGKKSILFDFSANFFEDHDSTKFSYVLEGYDETWSNWKKESKKEYTGLREGEYTFKVRSKNIYENIGSTAKFTFLISPPWYRSNLAFIVYTLFIGLFIGLLLKANSYRLKKSKEKLEKEVRQRTWDLQEANVILEEQHAELQQQKEEIISQKEVLEKQNIEIKKQRDEVTKHRNEITQKNTALQNQNVMITESITYAKTLQQHMLPVKSIFDQNFLSFLLYLPKNIVSGDFYWYANFLDSNEFLVALVDCTGHGVPGAFMTIMGIDLVNNIVNQQNIKSPSEIVKKLDQGIIKTLKQETSDNLDGMDLLFCKIKKTGNNYSVSFIGANRPFIYYSKANNSLKVIKGWAKTVGGVFNFVNDFTFDEKNIELYNGDIIYLTSDGFADQLNDHKEKYGSKNLYNILEKNASLDLDEQKRILEQELKNHQQTAEQYDDVTIWGIKLK